MNDKTRGGVRRSAIEEELYRILIRVRTMIRSHDRGVMSGFLLSLVPVLPIPLVGLLLGLFNLYLHKVGKLDDYDATVIRRGLVIGALNCVVGLLILYGVITVVSGLHPGQILENLRDIYHSVRELIFSRPHEPVQRI